MSKALPPILLIDDEKNMRLSLQSMLADEDYAVEAVESAEEGMDQLAKRSYFMVITDAHLDGMSGYEFLGKASKLHPNVPALMITAYATPKLAVEAIKAGAVDYLPKPFAPEELLHAVSRCAERHTLIRQNHSLRQQVSEGYSLDQIIGKCPSMDELRELIQTVAPTDATVLILGESGTGKELIAGALHALSQRANETYVRINCAAIPETLLESELFGHEKGAFTGALKQKAGRVEEADGGTIFLDEIGDMSRPLQAKLLRFLEDGSFTRVGGNEELRVHVRLIAATNRDIVDAIQQNEFREDLFHRLNVVQFRPAPLRDRSDDVLLLANYFLNTFAAQLKKSDLTLSDEATDKLRSHFWPGNVRELRNAIERAVILSQGEIGAKQLPDFELETRLHGKEEDQSAKAPSAPIAIDQSLDELVSGYEKNIITSSLERNRYSINKTADQLKVTRHALRYRMQRLNINNESGESDSGGDK
ncbi:MAG: response regulator [Verrucomicrobiales bacterium]|nr:response regulator [Verrucomicrobiales bacterium]